MTPLSPTDLAVLGSRLAMLTAEALAQQPLDARTGILGLLLLEPTALRLEFWWDGTDVVATITDARREVLRTRPPATWPDSSGAVVAH